MSVRCISQVLEKSVHAGTDLLMLIVLADYSDDEGNSYPAVASLARKCRMKARNANYILKSLQASGELKVLKNEGPKGCNRYRIMLASLGAIPLQRIAPLQSIAPLQHSARGGATQCAKPLQPIAPEPSLNRQEPSSNKPAAQVFVLPDWIPPDTWKAYCSVRTGKRAKNDPHALGLIVEDLAKFKAAGHDPVEILNNSIKNGWAGVFEPRAKAGFQSSAVSDKKPWEGAR
jgi:hypothetical protein